jgi:hypothetical protein
MVCLLAGSVCAFTGCGNDTSNDVNMNTENSESGDPLVDDGIDDTNDNTNGDGSVSDQLNNAGEDVEHMGDDALDAIDNGAGAAGDVIEDGVDGVGDVIEDGVDDLTNGDSTDNTNGAAGNDAAR